MHILFLSQVLPYPLDAGPKARSYFVLRHLAQKHRVTLLTFIRDTDTPAALAHLQQFCHQIHTVPMRRHPLRDAGFLLNSLFTGQPFLIIRDEVAEMNRKIEQLLAAESFDAVHADQLWMAPYAQKAKSIQPSLKAVLDQHNAVYLIPRRLAQATSNPLKRLMLAREARLLAHYEPAVCRRFDHVVWVTAEDRQAIMALPQPNRPAPDTVIPICGDPASTAPIPFAGGQPHITFLGGLHWPPNANGIIWFAKHVYPLIRAEIPNVGLTVIGKNPPPELNAENLEVTGYVTDLRPYLAQTAAFIVPLHAGGGMRVKIIDGWTWGLPIVSTTIGAEGITTSPGEDILIADNPPDFARAVISLLKDTALNQRLRAGGRRSALEKYNWQTVYSAWDAIYPA